jgi:putative transposase
MTYDPDRHHRRSIRLKGHDYSLPGAYFVTICTHERECSLGEITNGHMQLTEDGEIARVQWAELPKHYLHVQIDAFVIMPNHIHGIIVLTNVAGAGLQTCPYPTSYGLSKRYALPEIVRGFKTYSARKINERRDSPGFPVWQRNYYEHIVRNEKELHAIREYVVNNPLRWEADQDHPAHWKRG